MPEIIGLIVRLLRLFGMCAGYIDKALSRTGRYAGAARGTFVIVDNCMIVYDMYCAFRTRSFAFAAGDTSETAGYSNKFVVFFRGGTRDKVGSILRNHVN